MVAPKIITQKEFHDYIETQMPQVFNSTQREAVKDAFSDSLKDVDAEIPAPIIGQRTPGITKKEVDEVMAKMKDKNSDFSKDSKAELWRYPEELDKLHEWLNQAVEGDKEKSWL